MKLFHTADWHIGQSFYDHSRSDEHAFFFDWLLKQIASYQPDALCITGDVFDSPNPSAESQRQYYKFLVEATRANPKLQIIVLAGNHDSAGRLEAPHLLLEAFNITTVGTIGNDNYMIPIADKGVCVAVPFVRQGDYPSHLSYDEGVQFIFSKRIKEARERYPNLPLVAMGHLYASNAQITANDSSERIIGGLDQISVAAFADEVDYLALGHIHKRQRCAGRDHVQYAGSPLPMSFSEVNYSHGVNLVECDATQTIVEQLKFEPLIKLKVIPRAPAPLNEVLNQLKELPASNDDNKFHPYLLVQVRLDEAVANLRYTIEEAIRDKAVQLVSIRREEAESQHAELALQPTNRLSPFELGLALYRKKYNDNEMPNELQTLLTETLHEINQ